MQMQMLSGGTFAMRHIYGRIKENIFHFNTVKLQGALYHKFSVWLYMLSSRLETTCHGLLSREVTNKDEKCAVGERFVADINPSRVIVNSKRDRNIDEGVSVMSAGSAEQDGKVVRE